MRNKLFSRLSLLLAAAFTTSLLLSGCGEKETIQLNPALEVGRSDLASATNESIKPVVFAAHDDQSTIRGYSGENEFSLRGEMKPLEIAENLLAYLAQKHRTNTSSGNIAETLVSVSDTATSDDVAVFTARFADKHRTKMLIYNPAEDSYQTAEEWAAEMPETVGTAAESLPESTPDLPKDANAGYYGNFYGKFTATIAPDAKADNQIRYTAPEDRTVIESTPGNSPGDNPLAGYRTRTCYEITYLEDNFSSKEQMQLARLYADYWAIRAAQQGGLRILYAEYEVDLYQYSEQPVKAIFFRWANANADKLTVYLPDSDEYISDDEWVQRQQG